MPGCADRVNEDGLVYDRPVSGAIRAPSFVGPRLLFESKEARPFLPFLEVQRTKALLPKGLHYPVKVLLDTLVVVSLIRVRLKVNAESLNTIPPMKNQPSERPCFKNQSSKRVRFTKRLTAMYEESSWSFFKWTLLLDLFLKLAFYLIDFSSDRDRTWTLLPCWVR